MRTVTYIRVAGSTEVHIKHSDRPMSLCPEIGLETKYLAEFQTGNFRNVCPACSTHPDILDELFGLND